MNNYQPIIDKNNETKWVAICAWCDVDKSITEKYKTNEYQTTHGICKLHYEEAMKETMEYYEKNGFGTDNDTGNDGLPIVRGT